MLKLIFCQPVNLNSRVKSCLNFCRAQLHREYQRRAMTDEAKKAKMIVAPFTIGTHSGTFHCDEVLACYLLSQHPEFSKHQILRTRDQPLLDQCDIVVDVGAVFDAEKKRFDHHQRGFNETFGSLRPELDTKCDIKLSSAGLIYVHYGERIISDMLKKRHGMELSKRQLQSIFIKIYTSLIQELDAIDNGVPQFDGEPYYRINSHLSNRVKIFNPSWDEEKTPMQIDELFHEAMAYVGKEFIEKVDFFGTSWLPARDIVERAVKNRFTCSLTGKIIELERFCPWQEHLREIETELGDFTIKYVLFTGTSVNDFRVQCIPVKEGSFVCRKFLMAEWFGLRDEELEKVSGIEGAKFVHATGFIGGAKTREATLKMAETSLFDGRCTQGLIDH